MKRKINTKLVRSNDAVSAVIGVILMVAITVAIAATVFVYVNGMMETPEVAPNIMGVTSIHNGNATIELTGESIRQEGCRITVVDPSDRLTTLNFSSSSTALTGIPDAHVVWIDSSGDSKIGGGDTIKITDNSTGLDEGTWLLRIIDIQSGKPSMSLSIDIN